MEASLSWSCLTAPCFWPLSFSAHVFGLQSVLGLWQVRSTQCCADSPKTVPYPANLLVWALQVHIHQHSAVRQLKDFFLWCLHSLELREFPRRLKTNSSLGCSDPVCNLKYAHFKTGPVKHLASFLCRWDHTNMSSSTTTCQTSPCINLYLEQ